MVFVLLVVSFHIMVFPKWWMATPNSYGGVNVLILIFCFYNTTIIIKKHKTFCCFLGYMSLQSSTRGCRTPTHITIIHIYIYSFLFPNLENFGPQLYLCVWYYVGLESNLSLWIYVIFVECNCLTLKKFKEVMDSKQ